MKRLSFFLILATAIVLAGCKNSTNEPKPTTAIGIVGHTYRYTDSSGYITLYFARSLTCTYSSYIDGQYFSTSNLTYVIDGTNVDIYTDNSTTWAVGKRNSLLYHMDYLPATDVLLLNSATFYLYK